MKIADILDVVSTKGVSTSDLRRMTQQLQDAANKRVMRMMEDPVGLQSIVAQRMIEKFVLTGEKTYFSMKGLDRREALVARFHDLQAFMSPSRTGSSLSAWKRTYKKMTERLGGTPGPDFWKAYRELNRMYPDGNFPGGYDSNDVQKMLMRQMSDDEMNWREAVDVMNNRLTNLYEEGEEGEEFFELDDDDEDLPF